MGEVHHRTFSSGALDALHERPVTGLRQARPSDAESDAPSRLSKPVRKDSKIGLRGIFTRSKTGLSEKDTEEASSRLTGIRASLADFSHWPSRLHSSSDSKTEFGGFRRPSHAASRTLQSPAPLNARVSAVPWCPPAFFQVYPQAVKHAVLPVCKIPVETLARNTSKFTQGHRFALDRVHDSGKTSKRDTLRRRQRFTTMGNSRDWTTKIFVLISSGYLLQYAAEGTFDRRPEKILQLTATSAAFASDLVPGRHWVLQVASTTDANGHTIMDPKPRRSKNAPKENEPVSTMLLVLENAESMDDWLAILRKEIEFQGGRKKASETGEAEELASPIQAPSIRKVSVSDPLSLVTAHDFFYQKESSMGDYTSQADRASVYSVENSPTASMISTEGRRLDNLRHSGSSHRLSYISSGQRTMVTSADSSPACSPTRASFSSQGEESQPSPKTSEVRLRPNASAIVSRRQSIQAMISLFESPIEQYPHPYAGGENEQQNTISVPNFSVPHTTGRRFSTSSGSNNTSPIQPSADYERSGKMSRKLPPTSLLMSRPLSIVMDQPSPRSPRSSNSVSRSFDSESITFESNDATAILSTSPEQGAYTYTTTPPSSSHRAGSTGDRYGRMMPSPDRLYGMDEDRASCSPRQMHSGMSPTKYSPDSEDEWEAALNDKMTMLAVSPCSPKRSSPLLRSSDQRSPPRSPTTDGQGKFITARKSMPHLTEGPPPAPPPSCALPPIPRRS